MHKKELDLRRRNKGSKIPSRSKTIITCANKRAHLHWLSLANNNYVETCHWAAGYLGHIRGSLQKVVEYIDEQTVVLNRRKDEAEAAYQWAFAEFERVDARLVLAGFPSLGDQDDPRYEPPPWLSTHVPAKCLRVLVVDDEPLVLKALSLQLKPHADVVTAASTEDAKTILVNQEFDAVVTDYDLVGGKNGLVLLEFTEQHYPSVRRVLMSGSDPRQSHSGRS